MVYFLRIFFLCAMFWFSNTFTPCLGQNSTIRLQIGYGSYTMTQLKQLQQASLANLPVNGRVVESFPAYWNFQLKYLYHTSAKNRLGLFADYASTGGRVAYRDYSGEIRIDDVVSRYSLGLAEEYVLTQNKAFSLSGQLETSSLYSKLTSSTFAKINDQSESDKAVFKSIGFAVQPGLLAEGRISRFSLGLQVGYQVGFSRPFHLKGNSKAVLYNQNTRQEVKAGWSGIRVGATLGVRL